MFSFTKRKDEIEVASILRRIINRTTPNITTLEDAQRYDQRHCRSLPVLLTPRQGQSLVVDKSIIGISKDISDYGIALILKECFMAQEVAITFWPDAQEYTVPDPIVLIGNNRHCLELGGGFWQIGLELSKRLDLTGECEKLRILAQHLIPVSTELSADTV